MEKENDNLISDTIKNEEIETLFYDLDLKKFINFDYKFEEDKSFNMTFYDTEEFHEYHQIFADKVYRIVFIKQNRNLGYCYVGIKDNVMKAPYSAPFSMFFLNNKYRISNACDLVKSLVECCELLGSSMIEFTLPPEIYSKELINCQFASFYSNGFKVKKIDINNFFDFAQYEDKELYVKKLIHASRQNYNIAIKNQLKFVEIPVKDFLTAYDVIKINRQQMGYPLKISMEQMQDLIKMESLTCRCFGVKTDYVFIASAIIFDVTDDISQVIYWGDVEEYRKMRPMALLTTEIFDYYKNLGKKYLDIGPSSENGIINIGLADFKKSIGCYNNIKIAFEYKMKG